MRNKSSVLVLYIMIASAPFSMAQLDRIVIPAGTPEDQALQAIGKEPDASKKTAMYEEFVQKFSSNGAAVAYGNWQLAQGHQTAGDLPKALEYGDKALAGSPANLDILVSQTNIAQQMKNNAKIIEYAVRGGEAFNRIEKQARPEGASPEDAAKRADDDKATARPSYEFLEAAAFNAIVSEPNAKARMSYIERYTPAFPASRFEEQVASYALMSLSELKDMSRLVAYGEKALAGNPNSLATLLLLANAYADDDAPASGPKAITYAQKVISLAKADAADADLPRKLSAGASHSTIGYVYMKQDKTAAAIPELKTAVTLLKGKDEQSYALAAYRLGFAYAKLNKVAEAREVLTDAIKINGPAQQVSQDLLTKVNTARPRK